MLINWVRLVDFTSHVDTLVKFSPGMVGIVGKEGSGKTSVVTAIGIALFNHNPYNQKNLVRQGAKVAQIRLSFNSILDRQEYVIETHLGSSSDTTLWLNDDVMARGKTDVYNEIKRHLVLPSETDLASLAENGIITRQGELVTPFIMSPTNRKAYFSKILDADKYERAWNKLSAVKSLIDEDTRKLRESSAGLRGELAGLGDPDLDHYNEWSRLEATNKKAKETEAAIQELTVIVSDGLQQKERYDKIKQQLHGIENQIVLIRNSIGNVTDVLATQSKMLDAIEKAEDFLLQNCDAEKVGFDLDDEAKHLANKLNTIKTTRENDLDRYKKQFASLAASKDSLCPTCGEPLSNQKRTELLDICKREMVDLSKESADEIALKGRISRLWAEQNTHKGLMNQIAGSRVTASGRSSVQKTLQDKTDELNVLQIDMANLEDRRDELKNTLSLYNQQEHDGNAATLSQLETKIAVLQETIKASERLLEALEKKSDRKKEVEAKLVELQAEQVALSEVASDLASIREVIRKAGPLVVEQLVSSISDQASDIFTDLMRDHEQAALEWTQDYGIKVMCSGTQLDLRDDHVNGGKKSKAALAVRLAILNHLGSIGLIVLDEPTTNLDDNSRHNLAVSISDICSRFGQGIVISHSDEFGSSLNQVVRLNSINGISEVVTWN